MAKLRVPSLQHLSRNWKNDSGVISRDLVRLVKNPPMFNYNSVYSAAFDLLHFKQPLEEVMEGIRRKEKRELVRKNFLEIVPLIHDHFQNVSPDFVNPVSSRMYSFGQDLSVPFTPPLIYGVGGRLHFPWFSFWRVNPLRDENLSLFTTLVHEVLEDDPDFDDIVFEILDFSANDSKSARTLDTLNAADVPRLSNSRKREMLETFVDGYNKAKAILEADPNIKPEKDTSDDDRYSDDAQPDLFG